MSDYDGNGELTPLEPKRWPANSPPLDDEGIACVCTHCSQAWRVHPSLGGYRLRCDCSAYVEVPLSSAQKALAARTQNVEFASSVDLRDPAAPVRGFVPTQIPMEPGSLRHASTQIRQRWHNRAILELALIMAAFVVPQLAILFLVEGSSQILLQPLAALVSAVGIVAVAYTMPRYAFSGMRAASSAYYLEMLCVGALVTGLALAWVSFLWNNYHGAGLPLFAWMDELGYTWTLLLIAVFPAIFEELAFRGLVQPRLMALMGRKEGLIATAVAFGLAHGITLGLPFHFGLGLYLGSLRDRSQSLLPGMCLHFLYNGVLITYFA